MKKPIYLFLGLLLAPLLHGQSAANFDTKILAPDSGEKKEEKSPAAAAPGKEAGPVVATPSRYIGPNELESYIASQSSVFLMNGRSRDPFGQLQDPDAKPIVKQTATKTARRPAAVTVTPFSDIVALIDVKITMPAEQSFLIGTRLVKRGGQLALMHRGKQIRTEVTEVTSRQIGFRNLDTGETAFRKLDWLPTGMTPGNHGITAPGMVPDRPDDPLVLEAGEPVSN